MINILLFTILPIFSEHYSFVYLQVAAILWTVCIISLGIGAELILRHAIGLRAIATVVHAMIALSGSSYICTYVLNSSLQYLFWSMFILVSIDLGLIVSCTPSLCGKNSAKMWLCTPFLQSTCEDMLWKSVDMQLPYKLFYCSDHSLYYHTCSFLPVKLMLMSKSWKKFNMFELPVYVYMLNFETLS